MWVDHASIFIAFLSQDAFSIRTAPRADAGWLFGALATCVGGLLVMGIYRAVPFIDRHLEKTVMVWSDL